MAKKQLKRGEWSKEEIRLLKKIYGNNSTLAVAIVLHRPYICVKKKASRLGLKKSKRHMRTLGR